eukprot:gnl/MRDRNA2_/MRDRNA2_99243_c0_seq1.p1 gnl/MRDRNA2_/MRDRNA2_99243_c0~~gnl/MRDRNA2_/MRDRNA2_99243_c0_seq1.p1  ORF type:complete len:1795 (-),score=347.69 gnl/MRDRNA2_/MRDRNA2_99243_c0_seq1:142-5526(-)
MEITVTDSLGLPSKAYCSIRVGDTRRQGPFKKGEAFQFPSANHKSFIFDVFDKVGTAHVSLATLKETGGGELNKVNLNTVDGTPMTVGLKVQMKSETTGSAPASAESKSGRPARQHIALKAKSYLEEHGVQPLLQSMVHQLLAQQPKDPLKYMTDYLRCRIPAEDDSSAPPKAEEKAKPEKVPNSDAILGPPINYAAMDGLGEEEYPGFPADECPESMPDLSGHFSLLSDVLKNDPEVWESLKNKKTDDGVSFAKCIKPGMDNRGHPMIKTIGLVAGSEDSYKVFKDVFDPVISVRHHGYEPNASHPTNLNFHDVSDEQMDPAGQYVISVKVRACRNVRGLKLLPSISKVERREVERLITKGLLDLPEELQGSYYPLSFSHSYAPRPGGMTFEEELMLKDKDFLFQEPDSQLLLSTGMGRDWPDARGIFLSIGEDIHVTVNDEDHICITAFGDETKADLKATFTRFCKVEDNIHRALLAEGYDYMRSENLGYLSTCPSRVGTSMHANVLVKLPLLCARTDLKDICKRLQLQARAGMAMLGGSGTVDITNTDLLGSSEVDQVNTVLLGVIKLIALEKKLDAGESIEGILSTMDEELNAQEAEQEEEVSPFADVPGLGDAPYPGFPSDECPPELPDLSGHHSVMADILKKNPEIYGDLKDKKTEFGVGLAHIIKPGIDNKGHPMIKTVGMVAGDEESYTTFKELFHPAITMRHGPWADDATHPTDLDYSKVSDEVLDPSSSIVLSCRIRAGRNVKGFCLPTAISKDARRQVEKILTDSLSGLQGELEGEYYPLPASASYSGMPGGMSPEDEASLQDDNMLFQEPDAKLRLSSGMGRHWPDARGVFRSFSKDAYVWVNEEDHMRITTMQAGTDIKKAFARFCTLEQSVHEAIKKAGHDYMRSDHYGFLQTCPSNIGTGLRINVCCNLALLSAHSEFKRICRMLNVSAATGSMTNSSSQTLLDIYNSDRLGTSEVDCVNGMIKAIKTLVEMELQLKSGADLDLSALDPPKETSPMEIVDDPVHFDFSDVPGLGADEYPGFPADVCPETAPDFTGHYSLMADVLRSNKDLYEKLRTTKTPGGVSLAKVMKPGMDNKGHPMIKTVGMIAGDAECYTVFKDLFDPVISLRHGGFPADAKHCTDLDFSKVSSTPIDPTGKYVVLTRVRAGRNLAGLPLNPSITKDERREVERVGVKALVQLASVFEGEYLPLIGSQSYVPQPGGMSEEEEDRLAAKGALFEEPDSTMQLSTGVGRHWPDARGVFVNSDNTCMVWINEEEHLKLTSQQASADLKGTFTQFCRLEAGVAELLKPEGFEYMRHQRLGFLSMNPSNVGTGMRLSVFAKLPNLSAHPDFKDVCRLLGVTLKTVTSAESLPITKDDEQIVWELSSGLPCLGMSEVDAANALIDGCTCIINMEMKLENGEQIVVPGLGDEDFPGFPVENPPSILPDLSTARSMMADVLKTNPGIYDSLKEKVTPNGVSLAKIIKPGIDCKPISSQGVVAGDAESYETFSALFDPIIAKCHKSLPPATFEHPSDLNMTKIVDSGIDPNGKYVVSTSVRVGRNIANLCLLPSCSDNERREVERVSTKALLQMDGESQGDYLPLAGSTSYIPKVGGMPADDQTNLSRHDLAFVAPKDALQLASGFGKNWPDARGVFLCSGKESGVWINEKEHLVFFASQRSGQIKDAFKQAYGMEDAFKNAIKSDGYCFASSSRLGYISATPAGLGTCMQTKAVLKIPLLMKKPDFKDVCEGLGLEVGPFKAGAVEVRNSSGLGKTEVEQINAFIASCGKLIEAEQALEASE